MESALESGRDVLFDIDWQGAQQIRDMLSEDLVSVFVLPPSGKELHARLVRRAEDDEATVGFPADEAWTRELAELPSVPFVADAPGRPAAWPSDPPPHAPFDGHGLRALVTDAARRAWELCAGATDTGLALDERADLARRAVDASPMQREQLAQRSNVPLVELEVLATAWKMAGAAGVRANDEPRWTPPPLEMAAARDLVTDTGFPPRRVHVGGNRVTAEGRLQFRRSHDGLWYLFSKASGRWAMAAPPEPDVEDLLLRDLSG